MKESLKKYFEMSAKLRDIQEEVDSTKKSLIEEAQQIIKTWNSAVNEECKALGIDVNKSWLKEEMSDRLYISWKDIELDSKDNTATLYWTELARGESEDYSATFSMDLFDTDVAEAAKAYVSKCAIKSALSDLEAKQKKLAEIKKAEEHIQAQIDNIKKIIIEKN